MAKSDHRPRNVLVMRFSALGDVAMTIPVLYPVCEANPGTRFVMLTKKWPSSMFHDRPANLMVMGVDFKTDYKGFAGLLKLARHLRRKYAIDAVADLHNVLRSEFLRMRFNIDHYRVAHIDKHRKGRRRLTSANNKQLTQQPTSFDNYAEVFRQLGYPVKQDFKSIFAERPDGRGDLSLLPQEAMPTAGLNIGIAPFAAHEGKVYPPRLMQRVVEQLLTSHPQARIFLFGRGQQEEEYFSQWCQQHAQCVYVGRYVESLRQELVLMSHLDVMLSMDSANMHLASLTATPVVSVWGATHPFAGFMGWGQTADRAVQIPLDCRPCSIYGQKPCLRGDYACLNRIAPEAIVEKIEHIINTNN